MNTWVYSLTQDQIQFENMEAEISFMPNHFSLTTPHATYSNLEQSQQSTDQNSFQYLDQQLEMNSAPELYGNQIIIMEETNHFFFHQLMNELQTIACPDQIHFQAESTSGINQTQGNYQNHELVAQEIYNLVYQLSNSDLRGLPTNFNIPSVHTHLETSSNCNNLHLLASHTNPTHYTGNLGYPRQPPSRFDSEDYNSKLFFPNLEQPPNRVMAGQDGEYIFFKPLVMEKKKPQIELLMSCPVKTCQDHNTKFEKRTDLMKHCFKTHVHLGKPETNVNAQEVMSLAEIIPRCHFKTCERFLSRNDSLTRHFRQKHSHNRI